MKKLAALLFCLVSATTANAGIISTFSDETAFATATGAVSLTGPLTNRGNVGHSVTLGDATLSAGNDIFVGSGWSSLLPGGMAIAISGPENLDISINTGLATAFGFYFHEPAGSTGKLDGCNASCVDSEFSISFYLNNVEVDSAVFAPADNVALFAGFQLDTAFDQVRFVETTGGTDNEFFGEMFVAAAEVPEPASLFLLGLGLLSLGLLRRRELIASTC